MSDLVKVFSYAYECNLGNEQDGAFERVLAADDTALVERELGSRTFMLGAIQNEWPALPEYLAKLDTRNNRVLNTLFQRVEADWQKLTKDSEKYRLGIVVGTSTSGMSEIEQAHRHFHKEGNLQSDFAVEKHEISSPSLCLQALTGVAGPCFTVSTACSSGAIALLSAKRLIDSGVCDYVLCGGVDTLCEFTLCGFESLGAISSKKTQPFSDKREGINIGEGGALFILGPSDGESGVELLGGAETSDAHHQSAPHPEGRGAKAAIREALEKAELKPEDISYLNLHGTGTPLNDRMESLAVAESFGAYAVPCSSTKSLTGHLLAGAGALEAAFCCELLERSMSTGQLSLPAQTWSGDFEKDLPALNLVTVDSDSVALEGKRALAMSCSYAFGGSNAAIILGSLLE